MKLEDVGRATELLCDAEMLGTDLSEDEARHCGMVLDGLWKELTEANGEVDRLTLALARLRRQHDEQTVELARYITTDA